MAGAAKRTGLTASLLAAWLALAACSGDVAGRSVPLESFSAEQIYRLAEVELAAGAPAEAATYFGEVERLYPYSEWAKRALIMQAFAYHRDRDYENARASAQRFIDFYPADEDAAYAKYLLALSFYDQIDDVGRDQGLTFQALQALRRVIEEHPESEYARSAILKFDLAFDHLGGKEMEVGRFYLRRGNHQAAANRFRVVVEQFQTTSHTPEALYRLMEAYLALGLTDEAQTAGAILGYNFQASVWYQDGFALLTGQGLRPEAQPTGWLSTVWRQTVRGEWL
jgi:outer membrane protein assembly factor BamD